MSAARRRYDHRLRDEVRARPDSPLVAKHDIPRSTRWDWVHRPRKPVVSAEPGSHDLENLRQRLARAEDQNRRFRMILRLLLTLLRLVGFPLLRARVPSGKDKAALLRAIDAACEVMPLDHVLRILRLRKARYHGWRRGLRACALDDSSSCPRVQPTRLTTQELETMREMATSKEHRYLSISSLALLGQRLGKVFASASTWGRAIRTHGWCRPRARLHPRRPRVGLRATAPNGYLHLDVTILRLLDGTKLYIHAVIDNFSRKILSYRVVSKLSPESSRAVLLDVAKLVHDAGAHAKVVVDSGVENLNAVVDATFEAQSAVIERLVAQVEVVQSNSMVERFFLSLKHAWLYLHQLNDEATARRLIAEYVELHNAAPFAHLGGRTPDEAYSGREADLSERLAALRRKAREERIRKNRAVACADCPVPRLPSHSAHAGNPDGG